ncbi:hypothetical protein KBZ20_16825 [Vulcanococcus limneticus Candia 3F8]|uniref:hypothetical protein n=1 Tax=Vulcanococcus limneticus TaxID=2170428 RepID=UPI001E3E2810|nr:hypothetical protein [Vulcanococcus limneticus]MCP9895428.1 hypothetical protein [Vulcanococcus limneticus Candia 3F8]
MAQLYPELLQTLKSANVARHVLRAQLEEKKRMIIEVRAEMEKLESDLALEAETRIQLHAMNDQLLSALQEIEGIADDATDVVTMAHQIPRTRLGVLIERLKSLVKRWRAFKQLRSGSVSPGDGSTDG